MYRGGTVAAGGAWWLSRCGGVSAHARAVVAPLKIARGIQNKVLEALAMGKLVYASGAICGFDQPELPGSSGARFGHPRSRADAVFVGAESGFADAGIELEAGLPSSYSGDGG